MWYRQDIVGVMGDVHYYVIILRANKIYINSEAPHVE